MKFDNIRHIEDDGLKFESVDPQDEGLYQCIARNDFSEQVHSFYLHVTPRPTMNSPPKNLKCISRDDDTITVTFDTVEKQKVDSITYYIATTNPYGFDINFSSNLNSRNSFNITKSSIKFPNSLRSFKPFYIYIRSLIKSEHFLTMSPVSSPVKCAFQEIKPTFLKVPNGLFLRWNLNDLTDEEINNSIITIQFLKNDSTNTPAFVNATVGTYEKLPHNNSLTWSELEENTQKIPINSTEHENWNEISFSGNVTGIFILKVEEVYVRMFGVVMDGEDRVEQNNSDLKWRSIRSSYDELEILSYDARSVTVKWSEIYTDNDCIQVCTLLKEENTQNCVNM
jgi:hypothetical protein